MRMIYIKCSSNWNLIFKTDNPWPIMTPGDGVDNNDNDQVDEEDCCKFVLLLVIKKKIIHINLF